MLCHSESFAYNIWTILQCPSLWGELKLPGSTMALRSRRTETEVPCALSMLQATHTTSCPLKQVKYKEENHAISWLHAGTARETMEAPTVGTDTGLGAPDIRLLLFQPPCDLRARPLHRAPGDVPLGMAARLYSELPLNHAACVENSLQRQS